MLKKYWHIELTDGRIYPFQWKPHNDGNPLEINTAFSHPDKKHYILDISELLKTGEYPVYEEDDSFILVPKEDIKKVFYVD